MDARAYFAGYYRRTFFPAHKTSPYQVSPAVFDQPDVLDCLERETESAAAVCRAVFLSGGKPPSHVAIIGAGSGRMGSAIRHAMPDTRITDVDVNPRVVRRLANLHGNDTLRRAVLADAASLPFSDGAFDAIVAYGVFRYIADTPGAIREMDRVLSHGGKAFVGEGKMRAVVNGAARSAASIGRRPTRMRLAGVRLPRLSYFYYLLAGADPDPGAAERIAAEMRLTGEDRVACTFRLAGSSKGSIYGFTWSKP